MSISAKEEGGNRTRGLKKKFFLSHLFLLTEVYKEENQWFPPAHSQVNSVSLDSHIQLGIIYKLITRGFGSLKN